jgi:acyl-CoA reductase-like NAD-dependent aldehyde dehydrogenase
MTRHEQHYYGGAWHKPTSSETVDVISSATEEPVARVARGSAADVDAAVRAAREGFESWSRTPVADRAQWLDDLSAAMKTRAPQIARAISHEVGTALGYSTRVQAEFPISMIDERPSSCEAHLEEELDQFSSSEASVVGCVTRGITP